MKEWIKGLLSDAHDRPSTRLHLSIYFSILVGIGFFMESIDYRKWETLVYVVAGLSGISIFDKKGKKNEIK